MSLRPKATPRRRPTLDEVLAAGVRQKGADVAGRNAVAPYDRGALNPLSPRAPPNWVPDPRASWLNPWADRVPSERARGLQERLYGSYKDVLPDKEERRGPGGVYRYKRTRYNAPSGEEVTDLALRAVELDAGGPVDGVIEFAGEPGEERAVRWSSGNEFIDLIGPRGEEAIDQLSLNPSTVLKLAEAFPPLDGDSDALQLPGTLQGMLQGVLSRGPDTMFEALLAAYNRDKALNTRLMIISEDDPVMIESEDYVDLTRVVVERDRRNEQTVEFKTAQARVFPLAPGYAVYVATSEGHTYTYNDIVLQAEAFKAETRRLHEKNEPEREKFRAEWNAEAEEAERNLNFQLFILALFGLPMFIAAVVNQVKAAMNIPPGESSSSTTQREREKQEARRAARLGK